MKAYPEYKDSGVEWLGKVPEHWIVTRSKYFADFNMGQSPNSENVNQDGIGLPFIQGNAEFGENHPSEKNYCTVPTKICSEGDLLISVRAPVGALNVANKQYVIGRGLAGISAKSNVTPRFLWHALQVQKEQLVVMETGTTFKSVSGDDIKGIALALPCQSEQQTIASFLDHNTTRIDAMIAEKQAFIKLLKEKRQALISHVVTKGLDANVEFKDSGVEWLGEVPEHWSVKKLRYLGVCQNGINIGGEYFGSGYPFVSYGDVYNNKELPKSVKGLVQSTESDQVSYSVQYGDVFFTRTSETIDEIGFTSVCKATIDNAAFAGFLIRFRPLASTLDVDFSKYYFQNIKLRAFFVKEMNLVTRASLSQELLKKMPVVLPPIEQQREISAYLDAKTLVIDELINETANSISLLKEHRTALISAAVTGKIDVREST